MINKNMLFEMVAGLKLPADQYAVFGSGVLVAYDLKDQANDIDLIITETLFQKLVSDPNWQAITYDHGEPGVKHRILPIEAFFACVIIPGCDQAGIERIIAEAVELDGIKFTTLENTLAWKKAFDRPKDRADVVLIERYLEQKPVIKSSFVYNDQKIDVKWFDVDKKDEIPDRPWQQIYVIGDVDGKVPVVYYAHGRENLPGGHTEPGETLEQTLCREVQEELNMRVVKWQPIGYQVLTNPDGKVDYQFRAVAKLEKLGEFAGDVGGSVIGYRLVDIDEVNQRIGYGDVGEYMIERAKNWLNHNK